MALGLGLAVVFGVAAYLLPSTAPVMAGERTGASASPPAAASAAKRKRKRRTAEPVVGVYDPAMTFRNAGGIGLEHFFVFWQALDLDDLRAKVRYAEIRKRRVMISIEPYTKAANWVDGGDVLLAAVERGEYDAQIMTVCTEIAAMSGSPLVRWGHEMDDNSGRYPWAGRSPSDYIAAFRYFVRKCHELAPNAEFVWSPIIRSDPRAYYPGDEFVDHVGIPIWGYDKADRRWYGHERSFSEALAEKYAFVEGFDKPVIVAEFGVSGSGRYERAWLGSFIERLDAFPLVSTVAYFNDREPSRWPDGLGSPDWRVKPSVVGLD